MSASTVVGVEPADDRRLHAPPMNEEVCCAKGRDDVHPQAGLRILSAIQRSGESPRGGLRVTRTPTMHNHET